MTGTSRKLSALYALAILLVAAFGGSIFGGIAAGTADNQAVSLDCVGNSGVPPTSRTPGWPPTRTTPTSRTGLSAPPATR